MTANVAYLIPPGKIPCFITGKLRPDTPEENVRQRWARSLVEEYGYPKRDLGIEVQIQMGRAKKYADLAIYQQDASHVQEHIAILIEAKRDDKKPSDAKDGDGQLKSYMAASRSCRYGLWVGQERRGYEKTDTGFERIPDIPRFGSHVPQRPTRNALVPTRELKSVFKRCHNYIHANAGDRQGEAFHELIKLFFCKAYDEEESGDELLFYVDPKERLSESGQRRMMEERIIPLFDLVKARYPFIFADDAKVNLEPRVVAYVVSELQFLALLDTDIDVKGEAYEELVGSNLRGNRGEFFTPRNVCNMAVQMVMELYDPLELTRLKVLDCCCGTGGFLVSWLNNLHASILDQEQRRPATKGTPEERSRRRVREVCTRNLFGLDINRLLVQTCQMNLVLHGDGSSNIYRANSVHSPGEWDHPARQAIGRGTMDIVFTNPPFGGGGKLDDGHVLGQYELPTWGREKALASMPAEQLFIEAALRFVKPGGYLAIVVPDGIVNNPSLKFIRSWLLRRSRIVASVGLPKTAFAASKGINNPTVLIVQKLSRTEARQADDGVLTSTYNVFMACPRTAGINQRAKPIYLRQADGQEVVDANGEKIRDDEVGGVLATFKDWLLMESSI